MPTNASHTAERSGEVIAQPLIVPAANGATNPPPEFIRLPKPKERCSVSSLSRTGLNELIENGCIRAIKLRKKGSQRGITLIHRESLLQFLNSLANGRGK